MLSKKLVTCEICNLEIDFKSIIRHKKNHQKSKLKKIVKPKIVNENADLSKTNTSLNFEIARLRTMLTKIMGICEEFKYSEYSFEEFLENANLREETKKEYRATMNHYEKFCTLKGKCLFKTSSLELYAATRFSDGKVSSTIKKEISQIVSVLSRWDPKIKAPKIKNVHNKARYPIGIQELNKFMNDTKQIDYDLSIMGKMLYDHCLRINSLISLKVENVSTNILAAYDSKNSSWISIRLSDLEKEMLNPLIMNKNPGDFVFKNSIKINRIKAVTEAMNNKMKEIFNDAPQNIIVASHCFRNSSANQLYNNIMKNAVDNVAVLLRHSGTSNVKSYVSLEKQQIQREHLREASKQIVEI
jgi:site-specific recombinase XerD